MEQILNLHPFWNASTHSEMPTGPPLLCHSLPGTCVKHLVRSVFPKPHCGSLTPIYDLSISEPHYPNPPPHASFLIYKMGISITFLTAGETNWGRFTYTEGTWSTHRPSSHRAVFTCVPPSPSPFLLSARGHQSRQLWQAQWAWSKGERGKTA